MEVRYKVCDRKGKVHKIFASKNQAIKFKKEMKEKGFVLPLTIVEEVRKDV